MSILNPEQKLQFPQKLDLSVQYFQKGLKYVPQNNKATQLFNKYANNINCAFPFSQ